MARRRGSGSWKLRLTAAALLIAIVAGGYGWWHMQHWQPERIAFPVQGVEVSSEDGTVDWRALKAIGADFAYIDASASAFARDPDFSRNLENARDAQVQVGAVHKFDPCQPAEKQSANFVTVVPRDAKLLPPAIELRLTADDCPVKVTDAAVESELMTFLNQVETHTGKPAILKLLPSFESRYAMAAKIDRNLWLVRRRVEPDYAGRPWTLWTANDALATDIAEEGLRWVVVRP